MKKRIGILTGGGDCPGLNAVIRAVVKHARYTYGWDVVGIEDGFEGLYFENYRDLTPRDVGGLLIRGGTILGSSNRGNPFAFPVELPDGREEVHDVSGKCLENLARMDLEALVVVGGDGTMSFAQRFMGLGVNVVGIPKTIDNDLEATDYTVGFQTAVDIAVDALDRLHTTAESHDRIIVCEMMGRYAGWIALTAGLAGGADVILIPEIEYDIERVVKVFDRRRSRGTTYSIVAIAEGARPLGGKYAVERDADPTQQAKLGGAGQRLAEEIASITRYDVRTTVLGHIQRGGTPCAWDREIATRFGVKAVDLINQGSYGQVTALRGGAVTAVPLEQAVKKIKVVDPKGDLVAAARATGVELGAP
jgi:ATP-dependent phosphofructokinase / diphosphate-dependent phosphofructokinase